MASTKTCTCLLVAVLAACAVLPGNAQIAHINTKKPATPISSYRQYLERAGEAMGVLPTQPEAETTLSAHVPAAGPAASAMAPMSAPAGAGQPAYVANPDPTLNDWVEAYKPLDAAINHAFETRITKTNAVSTQFHLAEAAAPLQMLINDVSVGQGKAVASFAQQLFAGGNPLAAATTTTTSNPLAASTSIASSNPLTGIATTPTTPTTQPTTTTDGATVTATNPAAATVTHPAASTVTTADPTAAAATTAASTAGANPLGWLRVPGLGKKM